MYYNFRIYEQFVWQSLIRKYNYIFNAAQRAQKQLELVEKYINRILWKHRFIYQIIKDIYVDFFKLELFEISRLMLIIGLYLELY
jgi:hypothetical protein